MKTFNIVFVILFVVSAALQYNDPDPYVWMPIYLFAAWLCYRAIQKKYNPLWYHIGIAVFTIYAFFLLFDKTGVLTWLRQHDAESITGEMKATKPWIEETREFLGLFIIIVVLLINTVWLRRLKRRKPAEA